MDNYADTFQARYSTALLADAAFRAGVPANIPPPGLGPLRPLDKIAGPIVTVEANNDLLSILGAVHRANPGDIVVIANRTFEVALIGDLIAAEAKRKHLAGIIVDGLVRDATELRDIGVPVFSQGFYPVGPLKLPAELKGIGKINVNLSLGEALASPGDWAFGDVDGVLLLAASHLPAVFEWAEKSWQSEEMMAAEIRAGRPLGDLLAIESFLEKRQKDPHADFNLHLAELGRAI